AGPGADVVRGAVRAQAHGIAGNDALAFEPGQAVADRAARYLQLLGQLGQRGARVMAQLGDQAVVEVVHWAKWQEWMALCQQDGGSSAIVPYRLAVAVGRMGASGRLPPLARSLP